MVRHSDLQDLQQAKECRDDAPAIVLKKLEPDYLVPFVSSTPATTCLDKQVLMLSILILSLSFFILLPLLLRSDYKKTLHVPPLLVENNAIVKYGGVTVEASLTSGISHGKLYTYILYTLSV